METKFFEDYERELLVVNVLVTCDQSCTCYFNHYRDIAVYRSHLMVLELKLINELIRIFPCGVINEAYRRMLTPYLLAIKQRFHQKGNGTVTRPDLVCRLKGGKRVPLSPSLRRCTSAYVQFQWESLSRVLAFVGEDDRFFNFPYRFTGKDAELIHYCEALYTCKKIVCVSGEMNLRQFVVDVFHLLKRKAPSRVDLLINRIFSCKNRMLHFDKFRREYEKEILKGK